MGIVLTCFKANTCFPSRFLTYACNKGNQHRCTVPFLELGYCGRNPAPIKREVYPTIYRGNQDISGGFLVSASSKRDPPMDGYPSLPTPTHVNLIWSHILQVENLTSQFVATMGACDPTTCKWPTMYMSDTSERLRTWTWMNMVFLGKDINLSNREFWWI